MKQAGEHRIGDADGRDLGRRGDALDHRGADHQRQGQRRQRDQEDLAISRPPARLRTPDRFSPR